MNLTCYLVDDEPHALQVLKTYVERTPGLQLSGCSTDALSALNEVVSPDAPTVLFLDIDMPKISGMEFAGLVLPATRVIFTTSFPGYALEAFEKEARDYLLKPIAYERFLMAVHRIKKELMAGKEGTPAATHFYIKTELKGKMSRVDLADILYVEAAQNYIRIHGTAGRQMAYLTLEEVQEHLPAGQFVRVHRSFIVNSQRIRTVEHGQITLENGETVPLGRLFKDRLLDAIKGSLVQSRRNS